MAVLAVLAFIITVSLLIWGTWSWTTLSCTAPQQPTGNRRAAMMRLLQILGLRWLVQAVIYLGIVIALFPLLGEGKPIPNSAGIVIFPLLALFYALLMRDMVAKVKEHMKQLEKEKGESHE